MSDTLAAATLTAAVIQKMTVTDPAELDKEVTRLFRRYSALIKRAKEAEDGVAPATSRSGATASLS